MVSFLAGCLGALLPGMRFFLEGCKPSGSAAEAMRRLWRAKVKQWLFSCLWFAAALALGLDASSFLAGYAVGLLVFWTASMWLVAKASRKPHLLAKPPVTT